MAFAHSCFISYRHTKGYKGQVETLRIVDELKAELEMLVAEEVYRDTERLKGADFYNESLARAICRSVCMVVLFWPTYFDDAHLFCAREFKAMEKLEAQRLRLLPADEQLHGLILILALRNFDQIPAEIKKQRLCKDFESYTLKRNLRWDPRFRADMKEIASYIAGRCRAFGQLPAETFTGCAAFSLPSEDEVRPWVRNNRSPVVPFTNRESSG